MDGLARRCLFIATLISLVTLAGCFYVRRQEPKTAKAYYNRGLAYYHKGQYDRAIKDFTKAIHLNPRDAKAYVCRGLAYDRKHEYDWAIADCTRAIRMKTKDATAYGNRGIALFEKGQYDRAIADYSQAIRLNPKDFRLYCNRGLAFAKKHEYNRAITDYSQAIRLNPKEAKVYVNRGLAYGKKWEYNRAIADSNKAIRLNPKDAAAYQGRGWAYYQLGQYEKAVIDYTQAIRLNPQDAKAYFYRGYAYLLKCQYDPAIADFTIQDMFDSSRPGAKGHYDPAIADFTRAIRLNPGDATVYFYKAVAYEKARRFPEAIADYRKFLKLHAHRDKAGTAQGASNPHEETGEGFDPSRCTWCPLRLRDHPKKAREGYIQVTGGKVWYRMVGFDKKATPLVVLHGAGGPSDGLKPLEALADERPVLFYDQLGCGRSDRPKDKKLWTVERFVKELGQVLKALRLRKVHLFGHSWGTMLATDYMLTRPKGVESLILASPAISMPLWRSDQYKLLAALPKEVQDIIIRHSRAGTTDSEEYQAALVVFSHFHECRLLEWRHPIMKANAKQGDEVMQTLWGSRGRYKRPGLLKDYDRTGRLGEIKVPTLFTCGRYDLATPETTARYQSLVRGSKLAIFEKSAHAAMVEEPERYIQVLRDFLKQVEHP